MLCLRFEATRQIEFIILLVFLCRLSRRVRSVELQMIFLYYGSLECNYILKVFSYKFVNKRIVDLTI